MPDTSLTAEDYEQVDVLPDEPSIYPWPRLWSRQTEKAGPDCPIPPRSRVIATWKVVRAVMSQLSRGVPPMNEDEEEVLDLLQRAIMRPTSIIEVSMAVVRVIRFSRQ